MNHHCFPLYASEPFDESVILDSDHGTWNAYGNNYWPRFYFIDTQGNANNG